MDMYVLTLAMMTYLSPTLDPTTRHGALAQAISEVAQEQEPLFRHSPERTIALLVAVSFRESSLRNSAVGDHGRSFCAFQIHESIGGGPHLLEDPKACVLKAYQVLRQSITIDRKHPVAFYARGPRYSSVEAQRISDDRMFIANSIARLAE